MKYDDLQKIMLNFLQSLIEIQFGQTSF